MAAARVKTATHKLLKSRHKRPDPLIQEIRKIQSSSPDLQSEACIAIIDQFFKRFHLNTVKQAYDQSSDTQKVQILTSFEVQAFEPGETILTADSKKYAGDICMLLEGQVGRRDLLLPKDKTVASNICPGQAIEADLPPSLRNKIVSFSAKTRCVVLRVMARSVLKVKLEAKKEDNIREVERYLQGLFHSSLEQELAKYAQLFRTYTFSKSQPISFHGFQSKLFCIMKRGSIEISRPSHLGREISIAQLGEGSHFIVDQTPNLSQAEPKCKSLECQVYMMPVSCFQNQLDPHFKQVLEVQSKSMSSLHAKLYKKSQKILQNPIEFLKKKVKSRSKEKKVRKYRATQQNLSWDLIEHFSNQMNLKDAMPKKQFILNILKRETKSAYSSPRESNAYLSHSIEKIRTRSTKNQIQEKPAKQSDPKQRTLSVQLLPTPFNFKPTLTSKKLKHLYLKPQNEKSTLVKKTKYKLLKFAKGETLYNIKDYI